MKRRVFNPPVTMPSGRTFKRWRNSTAYKKTYHVHNASPKASDQNPGTAALPFKTIGRAAELLKPGERVLVHPGIYRECIRPPRGGSSPSKMIGYHAQPGGRVIVKGTDLAGNRWEAVKAARGLWALDLRKMDFGAYHPFALENLPDASFDNMNWAQSLRGLLPFTLPRGMVFQAGRRLTRVATRAELEQGEGTHWTDRESGRLFLHTRQRKDPNKLAMELTTRRGCFRPSVRGLGFIEVRGFVFEQVGNCFPRPQEGALSVCAGHHWLIEENTVRQVNGIGIDIGNGWYRGALTPPEEGADATGWHTVRRNCVEETGICGIAGCPAVNALIEENILRNNTWYPVGKIAECAAIKTHRNHGTLIRRNLIVNASKISASRDRNDRTIGIWMDFDNRDSRCTQNVMLNCTWGIYLEASVVAPYCLVDRNVIWGARQGIHEADSKLQLFVHNLIGRSETGVVLTGKVSERKVAEGHPTAGGGHTIANNLFYKVKQMVEEGRQPEYEATAITTNACNESGFIAQLDARRGTLSMSAAKPFTSLCKEIRISHDLRDRPWPLRFRNPGPLPIRVGKKRSWRLDW